jgi:hypothetical protein
MKSMHACLQNFRVDIDEDWGLTTIARIATETRMDLIRVITLSPEIAAKGGTQRSVLSEIVQRGPNAVLELVG